MIGYNRLWINLLRIQRSTMARLSRALRKEGIGDPIWHELMTQIERAGPGGLQMAELERRLFCAQYTLSRHVGRLEELGFVSSRSENGPGRSKRLVLTRAGQETNRRIWPVYARIIQDEFADRLTTEEAYDLVARLIRLYP
ncbi:transcriptional regulator, MarR family protein [Pseudooceanicola batsensis HTCC2597]|uniref:Transcriptional regulator, MarR family protein n=1 Tax=Pseudooceanicola batsensis (strain ATCC BAA-863 / DSM 15984 / KCTC 12145 / HTCC2597) TaxID=252305 RepID=A3TU86_PSEBH|nr:MarR family transcriptional regulator [Pseudooceanicola batsensis]EAQ04082.1 transcriptional regulator, MarR family protein [Pseudooceanicola batsensis HTCC2597]